MIRDSILDPKCEILDPKCEILDPKCEILDPKCAIMDLECETRDQPRTCDAGVDFFEPRAPAPSHSAQQCADTQHTAEPPLTAHAQACPRTPGSVHLRCTRDAVHLLSSTHPFQA
eukprot:300499-Rhodomonas_salina.4